MPIPSPLPWTINTQAEGLPVVKVFEKGKKRKRETPESWSQWCWQCTIMISPWNQKAIREGLVHCAVPCCVQLLCLFFFSFPFWEHVAFSLNGNYEGNKTGI